MTRKAAKVKILAKFADPSKKKKTAKKAGAAIKKGDPLDINMKLVDKAAQKDLDAFINRRCRLRQRAGKDGKRGTFISSRGPVHCDGSRGSRLPAACTQVTKAVAQWLQTQ